MYLQAGFGVQGTEVQGSGVQRFKEKRMGRERFEDIEAWQLARELTHDINERKLPSTVYPVLSRVPFGKFNGVNFKPVNVYKGLLSEIQ
jgi:hypothetical protein